MATYDEALFYQDLQRQSPLFKAVTRQQVAEAFWAAARDLEHNIATLKPERMQEARAKVLDEIVPQLAGVLDQRGYRLVETAA